MRITVAEQSHLEIKNTPIIEELEVISKRELMHPLAILTDDVRLFGFDADYPFLFRLKLFCAIAFLKCRI